MRARLYTLAVLAFAIAAGSGCAAGRAFQRAERAAQLGEWDAAVAYYTTAVQAAPERAEYKIALERASLSASHVHLDRARAFEAKEELEDALREYRKASEFDPTNRQAAARAVELEQRIRDRLEASRPRPAIEQMRERVRLASGEPILNPASREPLRLRFNNAQLRDILNFIANASGINITYDRDMQDRAYTVELDGVTLEQALSQILTANGLFYKVLNERTIIVVPDSPTKRGQYEEQVIRTFYVSHADVTELQALLNVVLRFTNMAVQPMIAANKSSNTITIRASAAVVAIAERVIESNDKPRAEIVIDVEILEVNRTRAKQFGLNLNEYALGGIFSPEVAPSTSASSTGTGTSTVPSGVGSPPAFNANTISRGVSTADFYLAVPAAVVRFLESDSETKLVAKPQLRGAEGQKLTLNLGDDIPVPSTVFTPIASGGTAVNPLTSFSYRQVGVNIEMTPRVTFEGEVVLELMVESSSRGQDVTVAGQLLPSFGSRKVTTKLRLRDGESNLLAGLLREDDRRALQGIPGTLRIPILKQLLGANSNSVAQTDIVMLLTPRIVRTHELTQQDLSPIYIGTQQNLGIGGPPPLIAPPAETPSETPVGTPAGTPPAGQPVPAATAPRIPSGSSPIPGMTTEPLPVPPAPTPAATAQPAPPAELVPAAPVPAAPSGLTPGAGGQILVTPPASDLRVGESPYTVPISISGAMQVTTVSLALTFNHAVLRVRAVQEGSFMRQGGVAVGFTQQVDAATGRVDLVLTRAADTTGASGAGLLAAVLFEAVAPGVTTLGVSGVATSVGGAGLPLLFSPATVTVR